jgi:hypothetical protein
MGLADLFLNWMPLESVLGATFSLCALLFLSSAVRKLEGIHLELKKSSESLPKTIAFLHFTSPTCSVLESSAVPVAPNPSIERTSSSGLGPLRAAARVKR